ncbi:hypothetical protein DLA64_11855 [Salmonella enterica]|nr:hypothetical protein [Salmonella enterica]
MDCSNTKLLRRSETLVVYEIKRTNALYKLTFFSVSSKKCYLLLLFFLLILSAFRQGLLRRGMILHEVIQSSLVLLTVSLFLFFFINLTGLHEVNQYSYLQITDNK